MKDEAITIPFKIDTAAAKASLEQFINDIGGATFPLVSDDGQWRMNLRISSKSNDKGIAYSVEDVRPVPKGEIGKTYFCAPYGPPECQKVYFNGECVHARCCEADLVGGWCILYEKEESGSAQRVHFGRVELRHDGKGMV